MADVFELDPDVPVDAYNDAQTGPTVDVSDIKVPLKSSKKRLKKKKRSKADEDFVPTADELMSPEDHYDYYLDEDKPTRRRVRANVGKAYFDEVLRRIKERKRKSVKITPEECQAYCRQIVERMIAAAAEDVECVKAGQPGLAKLRMLPMISEISKPAWRQWCITEGIAVALASWLTVLPDGSLPNLSVRSKVLHAALQLPFQPNDLRDNDLGKIIVTLWKHPDECESNKVLIRQIVQKWVRPMLGLASNYLDVQQDLGVLPKEHHETTSIRMKTSSNTAITQERITSRLTQMYRSIGSRQKAPAKATRVDFNGVL